MAAFSPLMGAVSDKVSPFKLASAGMGLCAAGTFIFIFVGEDTSVLVIIIALVVTGMGFALFSSPNTNAVMSFVEEKKLWVSVIHTGYDEIDRAYYQYGHSDDNGKCIYGWGFSVAGFIRVPYKGYKHILHNIYDHMRCGNSIFF